MHPEPFKNHWWKYSCKKSKKSPSGTILPHCMYFWPAQRGQFGSVLFSLSVHWTHLAIYKKENKLSWIILVKYLQYYSCHFLFRQYFVKNYPDRKQSQVSFFCYRLFLLKFIFFIEPEIWQLIAIYIHILHNRNHLVVQKMWKIAGNKSCQFGLMNHLIMNNLLIHIKK